MSADAIVVGSGPNGLAAAIVLARAGRAVRVLEAQETAGGGLRSAELTLPGFVHDVCAAIHPWAGSSPFLRSVRLAERGAEMVQPPLPLAHPLDDGTAVLLERSVAATADGLGPDAAAYRRLVGPVVDDLAAALAPAPARRLPRHPLALARMGAVGLGSAAALGARRFAGVRASALLAGLAAHSALPLERRPSAGIGLALGVLGHAAGWPLARGGSQRIADALVAELGALGGVVETGRAVTSLDRLPRAGIVMLDVTPRQLLAMDGGRLPPRYRRRLARYRYGPGAFKVDWALDGPVPWRAPECARAATVHIGGTMEEIAAAEAAAAAGRIPERPFVLLVQPSLFDPSRAPAGRHTVWAYCHLPHGSPADMTARIEAQVERFAPGFGEHVIARRAAGPARLERDNPNHVGGDIAGGVMDLAQLLARPTLRPVPYATPLDGVFLCSSATPPGPGAHGMCGFLAAQAALRRSRRAPERTDDDLLDQVPPFAGRP